MSEFQGSDTTETWWPGTSLETLTLRAQLLTRVREFFSSRGVLEVETPLLSRCGLTSPNINSFQVSDPSPGSPPCYYLQTSPEFAMKRLLAAGSGDIYQLCRAFRSGEAGRLHNPEFSMLEWYRQKLDYHSLMSEVEELVSTLVSNYVDLKTSKRVSYREMFIEYTGMDPFTSSVEELRGKSERSGIDIAGAVVTAEKDFWLDLLLTHLVEPALPRDRMIFVYDFPVSQAALAQIRNDEVPIAERFEVYLGGMEIANGYQELRDAEEQLTRFEKENRDRERLGLAKQSIDQNLIQALRHGLPTCAGVAMGFDRIVMIAANKEAIFSVLAFSQSRI